MPIATSQSQAVAEAVQGAQLLQDALNFMEANSTSPTFPHVHKLLGTLASLVEAEMGLTAGTISNPQPLDGGTPKGP